MEVFDEAGGWRNIYRQDQNSFWSLSKLFSESEREWKNNRDGSQVKNMQEGPKSDEWTEKLEVARRMESERGVNCPAI